MKFYNKSLSSRVLAGSIIAIGGMIASLSSNAQTVYLNNVGAKMHIVSGSYLNVDGTFENQTSGAIENNGTIEVLNDWTNADGSGVFTTNTGTVILDGASQAIGGTAFTRFFNLTASGSGSNNVKTLDQDISVGAYPAFTGTTGVLDLEDNVLSLNGKILSVNNKNGAAINSTGGGLIRSENTTPPYGTVRWNIDNATGAHTIPFGTAANVAIPFIYDVFTAGTDASNGYTIFSTYPTPTSNLPLPTGVMGVNDNAGNNNSNNVINRFWIVGERVWATYPKINYTFTFDNNAATDLARTGAWGVLRAQRYNPTIVQTGLEGWGDWLYSPANIGNTVTATIANAPYDYYDVWTLVDESNPLPIELIRFAGNCADGQVEVTWTTASETNNDFFTVQRSIDGVTFEDVVINDGAGNSSSIINYTAVDYNPYGGTSYYRLKQTDFDGASKYSDVVAVSCGNAATDFNLVNAYDQGNGTMAVVFNAGDNELYTVTLYDIIGKQITETTGKAYSGKNQINIAVGDLARGIYMVNLKNEFKSFGRRVMLH